MTSIVFPGQGSQTVGMVKDFYDNFNLAKLIFEEIEDYISLDNDYSIIDEGISKDFYFEKASVDP